MDFAVIRFIVAQSAKDECAGDENEMEGHPSLSLDALSEKAGCTIFHFQE